MCPLVRYNYKTVATRPIRLIHTAFHGRWSEIMCERDFCPPSRRAKHRFLRLITKRLTAEERDELDRPISGEELFSAIKTMHPGKAPGLDGFSAGFFQIDSALFGEILRRVFEYQLERGVLLGSQRHSAVSMLFKGGDRRLTGNYRPISLIPVEVKNIERQLGLVDEFCLMAGARLNRNKCKMLTLNSNQGIIDHPRLNMISSGVPIRYLGIHLGHQLTSQVQLNLISDTFYQSFVAWGCRARPYFRPAHWDVLLYAPKIRTSLLQLPAPPPFWLQVWSEWGKIPITTLSPMPPTLEQLLHILLWLNQHPLFFVPTTDTDTCLAITLRSHRGWYHHLAECGVHTLHDFLTPDRRWPSRATFETWMEAYVAVYDRRELRPVSSDRFYDLVTLIATRVWHATEISSVDPIPVGDAERAPFSSGQGGSLPPSHLDQAADQTPEFPRPPPVDQTTPQVLRTSSISHATAEVSQDDSTPAT
ncbi:hypothetical protein DYB32_009026 [Aphanomyces invadans]|uniref:Reverse transcriptase domain-containing protein n=1 Tax=Aphanomyces invadans TaxID=157072 RepID=A0A418AJG3_9STRA|nr:hypothetical protein DYB32_009026 [Aphanomyces invadans]